MNKVKEIPLARFERPRSNMPLTVLAIALLLVLVVGIVVAAMEGNWTLAGIFAASAAMAIVVGLLYQANNRSRAAMDDRRSIRWDSAMPEMQRQNVNVEVRELARILGVGDDSLNDLLSAYIVAEDLALRQIQQEENLPLMRHVEIGGSAFDAIMVDHDVITCIEVAFVVEPMMRKEKADSIVRKVANAKLNLLKAKSRLRLQTMIVVVTQLDDDQFEVLQLNLKKHTFNRDQDFDSVEIRFQEFELLQKVYLSD